MKKTSTGILFILLFVLNSGSRLCAQHYVRTKKNIGFFGSAFFPDYSITKGPGAGTFSGSGFAFGLTHQTGKFLYPELFFATHQSAVSRPDATGAWIHLPVSTQAAGIGLLAKIDVLTFNQKKKQGYCFGRMLNVIGGIEFAYPLGMSPSFPEIKQNPEFAAKLGLGMYSIWGGSSKGHMSWTIHWELSYRQGLTPLLNSAYSNGTNKSTLSSLCLTLRIIYHKSYKFSDM